MEATSRVTFTRRCTDNSHHALPEHAKPSAYPISGLNSFAAIGDGACSPPNGECTSS
jgi:hypothetical protein